MNERSISNKIITFKIQNEIFEIEEKYIIDIDFIKDLIEENTEYINLSFEELTPEIFEKILEFCKFYYNEEDYEIPIEITTPFSHSSLIDNISNTNKKWYVDFISSPFFTDNHFKNLISLANVASYLSTNKTDQLDFSSIKSLEELSLAKLAESIYDCDIEEIKKRWNI